MDSVDHAIFSAVWKLVPLTKLDLCHCGRVVGPGLLSLSISALDSVSTAVRSGASHGT